MLSPTCQLACHCHDHYYRSRIGPQQPLKSARDTCQQIRRHPLLSDPAHPRLSEWIPLLVFSNPTSGSETVWLVGSLSRRSNNIPSNWRWRRPHPLHHSYLTLPDFAAPDQPRLSRFLILWFTFDSIRVAELHELSSPWLDPERFFFLFARFVPLGCDQLITFLILSVSFSSIAVFYRRELEMCKYNLIHFVPYFII
jgi:hypothetical protein